MKYGNWGLGTSIWAQTHLKLWRTIFLKKKLENFDTSNLKKIYIIAVFILSKIGKMT